MQGASAMAHFADKLHVDKQKIDRVESAVLLSLIGGGLALCVCTAFRWRFRERRLQSSESCWSTNSAQ